MRDELKAFGGGPGESFDKGDNDEEWLDFWHISEVKPKDLLAYLGYKEKKHDGWGWVTK